MFESFNRTKKGAIQQVCWAALFRRICITRAILKLLAGRKSAVYLGVNEHFTNKADAERALLGKFLSLLCFVRTIISSVE